MKRDERHIDFGVSSNELEASILLSSIPELSHLTEGEQVQVLFATRNEPRAKGKEHIYYAYQVIEYAAKSFGLSCIACGEVHSDLDYPEKVRRTQRNSLALHLNRRQDPIEAILLSEQIRCFIKTHGEDAIFYRPLCRSCWRSLLNYLQEELLLENEDEQPEDPDDREYELLSTIREHTKVTSAVALQWKELAEHGGGLSPRYPNHILPSDIFIQRILKCREFRHLKVEDLSSFVSHNARPVPAFLMKQEDQTLGLDPEWALRKLASEHGLCCVICETTEKDPPWVFTLSRVERLSKTEEDETDSYSFQEIHACRFLMSADLRTFGVDVLPPICSKCYTQLTRKLKNDITVFTERNPLKKKTMIEAIALLWATEAAEKAIRKKIRESKSSV